MSSSGGLRSSALADGERTIRLRRTGFRLAALAISAIALVSACSSSGGGSSSGGDGKKLTTLTLDAAFFGPVDVPLYYAEAKGYFAQEGINVKFVTASSNTQLSSVLGGSVQFASTDPLNTITAAQSGAKFVNFMAIEIGYSEDVIMSKKAYAAAGLSANSTAKQKIAALADKPLGVISTTGENAVIFKYLFKYAGIPVSKLHMVQLGTPQAIQAALKQGTIAGANVGSPYPAESVAAGYAKYLFEAPLSQISPMGSAITQSLAATQSYYTSNQATIRKFIAGYQKGLAALAQDPTGTATFVARKYFSTEPVSAFMSSFKDDLPIIAKSVAITTAQQSALKEIAGGADETVPSDWNSFFVSP